MKRVLVMLTVMLSSPRWLHRHYSLGKAVFAVRVSGLIFDLGLDVTRTQALTRRNFFAEVHAIHKATAGCFHPKRFAMRFFGWYFLENKRFESSAVHDGACVNSIDIMRSWATEEPILAEAAEREIQRIVLYLYKGFEGLKIDKADQLHAQLALLKTATKA